MGGAFVLVLRRFLFDSSAFGLFELVCLPSLEASSFLDQTPLIHLETSLVLFPILVGELIFQRLEIVGSAAYKNSL